MCQLVSLKANGKVIKVAGVKMDYIKNIIDKASLCELIDKIVLFGSCLNEKCTEDSDIDIAVFGSISKSKMFNSRGYKSFINSIASYGEVQDYDILYFDSTKDNGCSIMEDIELGVVLYEKVILNR